MFSEIFFSEILTVLPLFFLGIFLIIAFLKIIFPRFAQPSFKRLALYVVVGTVIFNILLSWLQYQVWRDGGFTAYLLPPHQPWSYFIRYAAFNFWLADVLALAVAGVIYGVFFIFDYFKKGAISEKDLGLVLLLTLLVGWPKSLIFVPLFLALAIIFVAVSKIFFKNNRIYLTWPLMLAALAVSLFGKEMIVFLSFPII